MGMARPQLAGGPTGLKVALIVFVVLTVASLTFTIILYTQHSELLAEVQGAKRRAENADEQAGKAARDLNAAAKDVIGEPTDDLAQIKQRIGQVKETVLEDARVRDADIPADSSLLTVLEELYALFSATAKELKDTSSQRDSLSDELEKTTTDAKARDEAFTRQIDELKQQQDDLVRGNADFRDKTNQDIEALKADWAKQRERIAKERDEARGAEEKAKTALEEARAHNEELLAQLASLKPTGEQRSILQIKDGNILRTFAGEDIVYIDLGQRDGVRPGMTFSVYSADRGIPASGKGKAAIQVTNVFDTTSECRATVETRGDPILEGDAIANPVFDKSRQFRFAVAGGFDLDFDGEIEDPQGSQVTRLIERWGGKVVSRVDTRTDFVVLGAPPPSPDTGSPEADITEAERERASELKKKREAFDAVENEAKALSIPIMTRTQFLHFLGYGVPRDVPDDQLGS